jgi:hypothetical protein
LEYTKNNLLNTFYFSTRRWKKIAFISFFFY